MFNFIDNSFRGVPKNSYNRFTLENLEIIDNKVMGALMRTLGKAIKINTGTSQGKVYVRVEDVSTYLDARGDTSALFATRKELEKMMKNYIKNSDEIININSFFKNNHRYFTLEDANKQCGIQYSDEDSVVTPLISLSEEAVSDKD